MEENKPTHSHLEAALNSPGVRDIIDDFVIDTDPELRKLTKEQREKVKASWRKIDIWLDRWDALKKKIF